MTCLCLFMLYVYDVVNLSMLYVYDIVNLSMLYVYDVVNLWCTCIYSLTTGLSPQSLCVLTTVGNYCLASATTAQLGELSTSLGCNSSRALAHHIDHTVKDDVETRWPLWYGQDGGWDMPGCRVSRCIQVSPGVSRVAGKSCSNGNLRFAQLDHRGENLSSQRDINSCLP